MLLKMRYSTNRIKMPFSSVLKGKFESAISSPWNRSLLIRGGSESEEKA